MNASAVARIAAAVNVLRPEWPVPSLRTLLESDALRHKPWRDVAVALTWVACDPASKTPARVKEAGPWWRAAGAEGATHVPANPTRETACKTCGRVYSATPPCCDAPANRPPKPADPERVAQIRRSLR